jgi:hypothetical protein
MLPIDRENLRDALIAGAIGIVLWLLSYVVFPMVAHAQIAVTDPPVELATAQAAASLTMAGGAGLFQGQAAYLNSLMQLLVTGVPDANAFAALYPGWVDFGADAAQAAARITNTTMTAYEDAMSVAQSQAADFKVEDAQFARLEVCNESAGALGVLAAIQCGNEIQLAAAQQTQLLRQLEITRIILDAAHYGEQLNERSQLGANTQAALITAGQH